VTATADTDPDQRRARRLRRLLAVPAPSPAVVAAVGAVALVPWVVYLGTSLPADYTTTNWGGTWQGLDAALAAALAATALSTWRRWPSAALWACAAGVLMLADAWFDLSISTSGSDRVWSVVCACVEVPVALLVLRHGHRELRRLSHPVTSDVQSPAEAP
jgi:hypothetical protein